MKTKIIYKIYIWGFPTYEKVNSQCLPSALPKDFETEKEAEEWLMKQDVQVSKEFSKLFFIAKTFEFYEE